MRVPLLGVRVGGALGLCLALLASGGGCPAAVAMGVNGGKPVRKRLRFYAEAQFPVTHIPWVSSVLVMQTTPELAAFFCHQLAFVVFHYSSRPSPKSRDTVKIPLCIKIKKPKRISVVFPAIPKENCGSNLLI